MFIHPTLSPPIAFSLGPITIYWYTMMYFIAGAVGIGLAHYRTRNTLPWQHYSLEDLFLDTFLALILGGRIGFFVFYKPHLLFYQPWLIFAPTGGMSFYGGLIGVLIALKWYSYRVRTSFLSVVDFVAPLVPPGLALGRLGNFINGELWGRPTNVPWAMIFSQADWQPRHPSQLYELTLEGIILFIILWLFSKKPRPMGAVSGLFALLYAIIRFLVEFVREPDNYSGFIAWGWLTMGQLLAIPLFMIGSGLLVNAYRVKK